MECACEDKSMSRIFAGWAIVSSCKRVHRIANSIHIVKQLTKDTTPGLRLR